MRIPSGVPGFDSLVQGGFPEGAAVVVQGPAGKEKDAFLFQFIADGLRENASVLVVLSSVSPPRYQQELRDAGIDVDRAITENRLKFVDWFTYKEESVQDVEQHGPIFRASIDLANVGIAISRAIAALPREGAKRAAVEVLSPALSVYDLPAVYGFAQSTKAKLERFGFTTLFVLEKEMHDERTLSSLHQPFDGVVDIERVREGDDIVRKVAVLTLKGTAAQSKYVPLDVGEDRIIRLTTVSERELIKSNPSTLGRVDEPEPARIPAPSTTPPLKKDDVAARLLSVVEQRLRQKPTDPDALFVKAAALAKMDNIASAIAALESLALVEDAYPGLWVLKAKLHARGGDPQKAREARVRAQEIEKRLERIARQADARIPPGPATTFECPQCGARVGEQETMCPSCGVLFEGPEDAAARGTPPPKPKPEIARRRGLTNGLARESPRGVGRTNGLVNGIRGRTNGLVNGTRGRTNGLVNGTKGRTNGLVNGTRGRTNGLVNGTRGRGRTNGLVNGTRGRTNGVMNGLVNGLLSLRSGMTNGLTNGSGFTNGLGSARLRGEQKRARGKLFLIPMLSAILLLTPLIGETPPSQYGIVIDGDASDWSPQSISAQSRAAGGNPNADITRFGTADNGGRLAFFVEVAGTALRGGDAPPTMDRFNFFIDTDRIPATGYRVGGLGADRMIQVVGWNGGVNSSLAFDWDATSDPTDWRGWVLPRSTTAAASAGRLETEVEWFALLDDPAPVHVIARAQSFEGFVDVADFALDPRGGSVLVVQTPTVSNTITTPSALLLRLNLSAFRADARITAITATLTGSAPPSAVTNLRLVDGGGGLIDQRIPVGRRVSFQFPDRVIPAGTTETLFVAADTTGATGDTLGALVASGSDVAASGAALTLRREASAQDVGYLGVVPGSARIDLGFAEWGSVTADPNGDVTPRPQENVDMTAFGGLSEGNASFFYARVGGKILSGTWVPEPNGIAPENRPPPGPDADRDTIPDDVDPLPFDFDNDGIDDSQTGGDADGDSVLDYGISGGTDVWLNTTIPAAYPAPYGGRDVRVYIGPIERPYKARDDILRVFVDLDNVTWTGYAVGGLGADRMIELAGTDGLVRSAGLFAFSGSFPGQWSWSPAGIVSYGLSFDRLEFGVPQNLTTTGSRLFVEIGEALGARDAATRGGATRGTRGNSSPADAFGTAASSFATAPTPMPKVSPWDALTTGTRAGTLIDGNSNAISTQYNHQRKVVRAGDTPGTACDAAMNSDGCWYAVFYDQTLEGGTFYLRNTNQATETACATNKVASSTQGSGPATTATLGTTQSACWYVDAMTGRLIAAGNWETRLDILPHRGVAAYGEGSQSAPRYRIWDTSSFGLESNAATAAATIQWVVVKASPVSADDMVMAVLSNDNNLYVQTWDGASWTARWSTAIGDSITRRFDIAFEQSSGDALVVFGDGTTQLKYRKRVGGTWDGSNQNAGSALADLPYWVRAESRPTSDDVFVALITNAATISAMRWNGGTNAWGDQTQMTAAPSVKDQEAMDVAFDRSTGDAFVIWGDATNNLKYREFTTSWQAEANAYAGLADKATWVVAAYDPLSSSSKMAVGMVLNNGNFEFGAFDGSTWVTRPSAVAARLKTERGMDVAFEKDTGEAVFIFDTSASPSQMSWRTWTSGGGFSSVTAESGTTGNINTMQLKADPASNAIMALYADANSDLFHRSWSGSSWSGVGSALETSLSAITIMREAFMFAWTSSLPEYDVVLEIWDTTLNSVAETVGSCVDLTTYGEDIQCLISGVAEKTLASDRVARARVAHSSSSGRVRVDFDDSDTTGNSRVTLPTTQLDRIVLMRSLDTSGSTWGSQIALASGASADNPLLLTRDSTEPSIAIDSGGYLHVVWVSAPAAGDQSTLNLVRYTKTTVAYPTQAQLANAANWEAVTAVDDASTGYMPTVSNDTSNNPHIAWSGSKTSGTVYYRNKAGGTWRPTVSWGSTYTGLSVDVSPRNNYVSLARYYEAATNEIQYTVCKDLSTSNCDAAAEFTKYDGTAGVDTVATAVESSSYPSLATTYEANGDLWVSYAKDVATNTVQNGVAQIASGNSMANATISAVDASRSFLVFNVRENLNNPSDGTVAGRIMDSTTLRFSRMGTAGTVDIEWYVAEFSGDVSVQRGSIVLDAVNDDQSVTINPVDLSKAFPIISSREVGGTFNCDDFVRATLTTATTLQLSACAPDTVVEWQVVEYADSSVQTGAVQFLSTDPSKTVTLSNSVDVAKSWLLFTHKSESGTSANIGQKMVRGQLTDSSTLTFDRNTTATGTIIDLRWYLVTFTDDTTTRRGSASFSTTDTFKDAALSPSVDSSRALAFTGNTYPSGGGKTAYAGDDLPGVALATLDLTSSTNLRLTRATTQSSTTDVGWFVVEFPASRAVYARSLDYPSGGWQAAETVDFQRDTTFTRPSIGIDASNNVHALYARSEGPQLYYKARSASGWGSDSAPSTLTVTRGTLVGTGDITMEDGSFIQYRETFSSKVGAFNIGTNAAGWTVPITGLGFAPKAVIFWWSGTRTTSTDVTGGADHARGFGVAVSPTDRRAVYSQSDDAADPIAADSGHHNAAVIGTLTVGGAVDGLADLQSMDPDGFTLVIDDAFALNVRVHYLALGGADLTNAVTGIFSEPTSAGDQDIDTVGFQPDAVILFSARIGNDNPATATDSNMMVGVAAGATPANAVWAAGSNDGAATAQTISYSRAGESIALFDLGLTITDARAGVTQWLSNGFRLNWAERTSSRRIHYLALKGGQYLVGDINTRTDTTPIVESGFGFSPKAGLLLSNTWTANAADAPTNHDALSVGAFTSDTERGAQATFDEDNTATAEVATSVEHDEVYVNISAADAVEGLMDIQSVGSDGFTAIMDDTDPGVAFVWYLAFGARDAGLEVRYDWSGVPSGTSYTLKVKGYRTDEDIQVQVLTPPSTWTIRFTITATTNTVYTYTLTSSEYNSGAPSIRFVDATATDATPSDLFVDLAVVTTTASRYLVDGPGDNPTLIVRGPNDSTYGGTPGGLYWKASASETYFWSIPEFPLTILPMLLAILLFLRRRRPRAGTRRRRILEAMG